MADQSFMDSLWSAVLATSFLEWAAVLTGVLYVVFASYRSMICWLFAFLSSCIYVYICFTNALYIETGLQVFYVAMAVYGWFSWRQEFDSSSGVDDSLLDNTTYSKPQLKIHVWSWKLHAMNLLLSGFASAALGYVFSVYTDQANPYMDAFTTVFSLLATFMVTRGVLENWVYWIVIDIVSIFLYFDRGLQLSALLYALFTILAVIGFVSWLRQYKLHKT